MAAPMSFAAARAEMERRYGILANHVPELIDMRFGRRRAIQLSLADEEYREHRPALLDFCRRAGFELRSRKSRGARKMLLLREGKKRAFDVGNEEQMGRRFGYPTCCARNFLSLAQDPFINEQDRRLVAIEALPFELNPYLRTSPFHLFKHFPCRPDCAASLRTARRLLALVRAHQPRLAHDIERFNRWPALVTGVCGLGFVFDGELLGERLRYREAVSSGEAESLLPLSRQNHPEDAAVFSRLAALLSSCDEVALDEQGLSGWRRGQPVGRVRRPAHLTWRWLRFA
ncbi:MAG: hypothetical protein GYA21_12985 [Myxococcales bacterium]|nr:hypothetical protein [Myxococcales bacterium]